MSDSSYDVDEILKQVRKRREENEARIKAQAAENAAQPTRADENIKPQAPAQSEPRSQEVHEERQREPQPSEPAQQKEPARQQSRDIPAEEQEAPKNAPRVHYDDNGSVDVMSFSQAAPAKKAPEKKGKKAKKKASKLTKILRAVICVLLAFIIAGGAGIYLYVNKMLTNATDDKEQTDTIDEWSGMDVLKEEFSPIYEDEDVYSYRDMLKKWYYNGEPVSSTHVLNVLLIGEDTRGEEIMEEDTRADSAIIASVNIDTKTITLTSVLRDSYVYYEEIEGDEESGRYDKINSAMAYGGIDCYIRAVENNLKINIDNYAIVNFSSFENIVDTLGGVTVELTQREINEINNNPKVYGGVEIDAEEGLVDLNGEQALAYCRIRHIDSDNARADRQKTVLLKIFEKMSGASTVKAVEVANALLPYVKMGFAKSEVLDIGSYALRHGWTSYLTETQTVPENTTDENGKVTTTCRGGTFFGVWCWKVDLPLTAQLLQQSIYGKTNITLAEDRPDFDDLPLRG